MIRVRLVDPGSLSAKDVQRWDELALSTATPNPFYESGFVRAAVDHLPSRRVKLLVAGERADEWIGLIPVVHALRWRKLVLPTLTPWPSRYCFLDAPLMARGREEDTAAALLHEARRGVGIFALDRLPADGPVASAVASACDLLDAKPIVWRRFERAALHRRDVDNYVVSALSGKGRRELGRRRRLLDRESGTGVAVVDRADDPQAVEEFLALEAGGWKGKRGTALASANAAGFFRAICRTFAEAGRLQLLALQVGERTAAMQCSLISGGGLFCFKIAFDESLARLAPGVQLVAETASAFHRRPELDWVDSCCEPDADVINRLWPDRRQLATLLIPGGGIAGGVASVEATVASMLQVR